LTSPFFRSEKHRPYCCSRQKDRHGSRPCACDEIPPPLPFREDGLLQLLVDAVHQGPSMTAIPRQ
jgi:hypothetical protein